MAESSTFINEGSQVDVWIANKKRWTATHRAIFDAGKTVIVEIPGALFGKPDNW